MSPKRQRSDRIRIGAKARKTMPTVNQLRGARK
jgi:hypothetical protein